MRRILLPVFGVGLTVALVLGIGIVNGLLFGMNPRRAQASPSTCLATVGPVGDAAGTRGQRQAAQLDAEQRAIAARIIEIGKQRGVPARGWQVALQAGMTESRLRDVEGGHADSVGIFQIRGMHGPLSKRTQVDWQINWFYDTLMSIPGWQQMRPGTAAQRVERSAFPTRYHEWEALAMVLVSQLGGVSNLSGCSPGMNSGAAPSKAAQAAIEAALSKQGAPYVWGAKGPEAFDCSGLVYWAYKQAGITIPRGSWMQWDAGQRFPLNQAKPGDLVFWAYDKSDPDSIHHVAMYLGKDKIVQAPYTGQPVQVSPLHSSLTSSEELMPMVVRPGT